MTRGNLTRGLFWVGLMSILAGCASGPPVYKDAGAPVDRRVDDLLGRMTLAEKVQQLRCIWQIDRTLETRGAIDQGKLASVLANGIGECGPFDYVPEREVAERNEIQKYLVENTRLGIPAIFHNEGCHGFLTIGATSFPIPIGMADSWDPELMERVYTVVAGEMRARGVSQALTPIVDIDRDPRWGRTDETMGEDPYLIGKLGAAIVRGFQGSGDGSIADGHVAATLKHFAGHGAPEGGVNRAPADIPPREMYDAHLVPFRIAIAEGHPAAIMPAYTEVDGVPSHANSWLLRDVLRNQFGFKGLVVSDYSGVEYLSEVHHVAADTADAARLALAAGVQVNLPAGTAYGHQNDLVATGRVPMDEIDEAVRAVLELKFKLGLFEKPYADANQAISLSTLESSKALALEAAQKSLVLLKNENHILPLSKDVSKIIAIIGPNAASARLGSYSGDPLYKVSILDGVKRKLSGNARVLYAQGCQIVTNLPESSMAAWNKAALAQFPTEEQNRKDITDAVDVAKQADVIILALGENEMMGREAWAGNHIGDRSSLDLPGAQNELADAIFALGKPVIVYLMNGRPLAIPHVVEKADAVIEGWYMGQETGNAAADVLFGDCNPSGKLTITVPRSVGQLPDYYDCKPGARIYDYIDESNKPLFPFGFGLSYTKFEYSQPTLSATSMNKDGQVTVSETVTNTGSIAGDEIVQLYIHEKQTSVTRPIKELKGFKRISLTPGQSQTISFTIDRESLAFHDLHMDYVVEPGDVEVKVGPSSVELKKAVLKVTE